MTKKKYETAKDVNELFKTLDKNTDGVEADHPLVRRMKDAYENWLDGMTTYGYKSFVSSEEFRNFASAHEIELPILEEATILYITRRTKLKYDDQPSLNDSLRGRNSNAVNPIFANLAEHRSHALLKVVVESPEDFTRKPDLDTIFGSPHIVDNTSIQKEVLLSALEKAVKTLQSNDVSWEPLLRVYAKSRPQLAFELASKEGGALSFVNLQAIVELPEFTNFIKESKGNTLREPYVRLTTNLFTACRDEEQPPACVKRYASVYPKEFLKGVATSDISPAHLRALLVLEEVKKIRSKDEALFFGLIARAVANSTTEELEALRKAYPSDIIKIKAVTIDPKTSTVEQYSEAFQSDDLRKVLSAPDNKGFRKDIFANLLKLTASSNLQEVPPFLKDLAVKHPMDLLELLKQNPRLICTDLLMNFMLTEPTIKERLSKEPQEGLRRLLFTQGAFVNSVVDGKAEPARQLQFIRSFFEAYPKTKVLPALMEALSEVADIHQLKTALVDKDIAAAVANATSNQRNALFNHFIDLYSKAPYLAGFSKEVSENGKKKKIPDEEAFQTAMGDLINRFFKEIYQKRMHFLGPKDKKTSSSIQDDAHTLDRNLRCMAAGARTGIAKEPQETLKKVEEEKIAPRTSLKDAVLHPLVRYSHILRTSRAHQEKKLLGIERSFAEDEYKNVTPNRDTVEAHAEQGYLKELAKKKKPEDRAKLKKTFAEGRSKDMQTFRKVIDANEEVAAEGRWKEFLKLSKESRAVQPEVGK